MSKGKKGRVSGEAKARERALQIFSSGFSSILAEKGEIFPFRAYILMLFWRFWWDCGKFGRKSIVFGGHGGECGDGCGISQEERAGVDSPRRGWWGECISIPIWISMNKVSIFGFCLCCLVLFDGFGCAWFVIFFVEILEWVFVGFSQVAWILENFEKKILPFFPFFFCVKWLDSLVVDLIWLSIDFELVLHDWNGRKSWKSNNFPSWMVKIWSGSLFCFLVGCIWT